MRPSTARQRAYHFACGLAAGGGRLPALRTLARMAGVSPVTMWKAVRQLRSEAAAPVGRAATACSRRGQTGPRWEHVATAIRQAILAGAYLPGAELPSAKELAGQHGACYRTVAAALASLLRSEGVVRYRRGYRVAQPSGLRPSATVALIARGDASGNLHLLSSRTHGHLQALERECGRAGVGLAIVPYDYAGGRLWDLGALSARRLAQGPTLGFIIWQIGIKHQQLSDLILQLATSRLPLAVLDEDGEARIPAVGDMAGRSRVFAVAHTVRAGREAGGFLLGLGHRRVAYISPGHEWLWSVNRLAGLREAFSSAGAGEDAVRALTLQGFGELLELVERGRNIQRNVSSLAASGLSLVGRRRSGLAASAHALQRELSRVVRSESYHAQLQPLLRAALGDRTISAWVAANDDVALHCLEFLAGQGRSVPADLSVLGFDDSLEAFFQKVSSYNFNGEAVMRAMLGHILDTRPHRAGPAAGPVEIEGFVTVRRTTGKVRR